MTDSKRISIHNSGILKDMDATAIAENIRTKQIQVKEVLECVSMRAAMVNPIINAIVAEDYVLNAGNIRPGIFSGVPMFFKDLVPVKGFPLLCGSKAIQKKVSHQNGESVEQIESLGFVTVGKSSTSEFGFTPGCETLAHGITRNPLHTEYSTGGSSGGAAALVAAGIVPIAHAMDGGGSIRIPASNCGLIGLKPTQGRILGADTASLPVNVTHGGVVTSTVRDTANFCYGIEQYYNNKKLPAIGYITGSSGKKLKAALLLQSFSDTRPDSQVIDATENAAKSFEKLGHSVEYISFPHIRILASTT